MAALTPRVVFVTRETDLEMLLARHATREQARFFLQTRSQSLEDVEKQHERFSSVLYTARAAVPDTWRQTAVKRADLDRFLFTRDDIVVAVGQDGLVANVAKYLDGQPVLGVNPAPDRYDGILVCTLLKDLPRLLPACLEKGAPVETRTMVEAVLDGGDRLLALNEIFIGHKTHQSARYRISFQGRDEMHSSSGLIVSSGTGATGWARSIMEATGKKFELSPQERALAFFVREPFPSVATGTSLRAGKLTDQKFEIQSQMNEGGVIFADGIEQDFMEFGWGRRVEVKVASRILRLVADRPAKKRVTVALRRKPRASEFAGPWNTAPAQN